MYPDLDHCTIWGDMFPASEMEDAVRKRIWDIVEVEARNLKLVPCTFEMLSSLKRNFHKSELFCFGNVKNLGADYVELF